MYNSTLSLTSALDGVGDGRHAPAALPPLETRLASGPVYTRAENLPTPRYDPRTVQAVATRYAD